MGNTVRAVSGFTTINVDGIPQTVALCKFVTMAQDVGRYGNEAIDRRLERKSKWFSELADKPTYIMPYAEKASDTNAEDVMYKLKPSFLGYFDEYQFDVAPDAKITHKVGRRWQAKSVTDES